MILYNIWIILLHFWVILGQNDSKVTQNDWEMTHNVPKVIESDPSLKLLEMYYTLGTRLPLRTVGWKFPANMYSSTTLVSQKLVLV